MEINTKDGFCKDGFVIRSVSITFYHKTYGFLLCTEMRKIFSERILHSHLIGGKVEMSDDYPLATGLREFSEETGFSHPNFFYLIRKQKRRYYDYVVSEKKMLLHRFYVIDITNNPLLNIFIQDWTPTEDGSIKSLFFWKVGEPLSVPPTSLLEFFTENPTLFTLKR